MRNRIALSVASIGVLIACGPVSVDLGGGHGDSGSGGTGYPGTGGGFSTGGTHGEEGYCGDGIVQYPEVCDDFGDETYCLPNCGLVGGAGGTGGNGGTGYAGAGGTGGSPDQYCGDGIVQYPEICDDPYDPYCPYDCGLVGGAGGTGGRDGTGGTAGTYAIGGTGGSGYAGGPSVGLCGDGFLDFGEQCDDGNTEDGDACPSDCGIATGAGGTSGIAGAAGSYSIGGSAGYAGSGGMGGLGFCATETVDGGGECADNDVLIGQAYERCMQLDRNLTNVYFISPCGDYGSFSILVDCCMRPYNGAAGAPGTGGSN
jgi:cysteine-rich repeat protein